MVDSKRPAAPDIVGQLEAWHIAGNTVTYLNASKREALLRYIGYLEREVDARGPTKGGEDA